MEEVAGLLILVLCLSLSLQGLAAGTMEEMDDHYQVYMAWVINWASIG